MRRRIAAVLAAAAVSITGCSLTKDSIYFLGTLMESRESVAHSADRSDRDFPQNRPGVIVTDPEPVFVPGTEVCAEYDEAFDENLLSYAGEYYMDGYPEPDWNTEEYRYYQENGWQSAAASPFSTFGADTDTASYANVRRMLLEGRSVPADAVKIEEWINYFDYSYPSPEGDDPFSFTVQIAPCPWNDDTQLLHIGLKAAEDEKAMREPSNLVFLIDVSGSMDEYNKLPLVQRAFRLLVNELDDNDRISVVTYADKDTVVLEGVPGSEKTLVCDAIEGLEAGGGTNGSDGINRAYELAEEYFIKGGNNRVIFATDGDLNIGMTDEGSLARLISKKAKSGVFLSVLGFGEGNISDANMHALADNGNGNYSYIDTVSEARKVLVEEAGGNLLTVASDVKLQMEFNPEKVKGYRLIGYEKRAMEASDFADDARDGGEIGSGHCVTAIYEIAAAGSDLNIPAVTSKYSSSGNEEGRSEYSGEWGTLHLRYKKPGEDESSLTDTVIDDSHVSEKMSDDLSWAAGAAQAAMVLQGSEYAGSTDIEEVRERLKPLTGNDQFREEFLYLLTRIGKASDAG